MKGESFQLRSVKLSAEEKLMIELLIHSKITCTAMGSRTPDSRVPIPTKSASRILDPNRD